MSYWSNPKNPRVSNAIVSVKMLEAGMAAAGTPGDVARDAAKAAAVAIKIAVVVKTSVLKIRHKIRRKTLRPPPRRVTSPNDAGDGVSLSLRQVTAPNWSTWVLF